MLPNLLFGTTNPEKISILQHLLQDFTYTLRKPSDFAYTIPLLEVNKILQEKALNEANTFFKFTGLPTIIIETSPDFKYVVVAIKISNNEIYSDIFKTEMDSTALHPIPSDLEKSGTVSTNSKKITKKSQYMALNEKMGDNHSLYRQIHAFLEKSLKNLFNDY